ncbi:MAG: hypothetical protein ACXVRJ_11395, partial [Gaiellaceae bacterium]
GGAPPAPNPAATAALDQVSSVLATLPPNLDATSLLELLAQLLAMPDRNTIFPAVVPILDDLRDPLLTLVAWKNMSAADVKANLATTLTATATFIGNRLDDALSPLSNDLAALAPKLPAAVVDAAGSGLVTRLGELRTAIAAGDLAGTGAAVTALNGHLDDLDSARTAFGTQVTPKLPALLAGVKDLDGRIEDALVQIVSAVDPSPTLGFIEPLSQLILDNAAANPITEFQQWLGTFVSWLQDLVAALDLSAVKGPLQTASDGAHAILDAFDDAVAGVTVAVQTLFHDVESLVDALDTTAVVGGIESGLHDFESLLDNSLSGLFEPARDAVHTAVTAVDSAVQQFDPQQVTDALQALLSGIESILGDAAAVVKEVGDTLKAAVDQVAGVQFAPIVDDVIKGIEDVTDILSSVAMAVLPASMQTALHAALAALPQDLQPVVDELTGGFDDAVNNSAIPALDELRGEPQKLLDEVKKYEPSALVGDQLTQPFEDLLGTLTDFTPSSLLAPVRDELVALEERISSAVDPSQVLAPLEEPFQSLLDAFDSLQPDEIVQPIQQAVDDAISSVLDAAPIGDAVAAVEEVLAKAQEAGALGDRVVALLQKGHELLAGVAGAPGQTSAWLDAILSKVDAAGSDASIAPALTALNGAIDGTQAASLTSRIDSGMDPVLGPLVALDPHARLSAIIRAKNQISLAALNALPDSADKTALQDVLDRFDPLTPDFGAPFESLSNLQTALGAAKTAAHALLNAAWDATYTGPDGVLHDLHGLAVGPQVGQSVRQVIDGTLAGPLNALFAMAAPAATAVDAVLTEVKKLVDDLDAKVVSLASGPGSLTDILDSIQGLIQRLNAVDLGFLTTSLDAVFTDVRSKIEALDPAALATTLRADFDAVLDKIDPDLLLPKTDLDELDSTYHAAIDKLEALDPGKIITEVLQPAFDNTIPPLLSAFDLTPTLDTLVNKLSSLKDELKQELDKVNEAYKHMLAAAPDPALGAVAGAASAALGGVADAVGIGI